MSYILFFIKRFLSKNPSRSIAVLVIIIPTYLLCMFQVNEQVEYPIVSQFKDGTQKVIVYYNENNSNPYMIKSYTEDIEDVNILDNKYIRKEMTEKYGFTIFFSVVIYIVFIIMIFYEEYEMSYTKLYYYRKKVVRHEDGEITYYVIDGKVIKKVKDEDTFHYISAAHLDDSIETYIDSKNILPDFKGTRAQIRDKNIKEMLD